jgi:hypothetical protein
MLQKLLHLSKYLTWLFGPRLTRLLRALANVATPEDDWAKTILATTEYQIYLQMDKRDREHATIVARHLQSIAPNASNILLRAAFLHDCGKLLRPYNPWERFWVSIYAPLPRFWPTHLNAAITGSRMPTRLEAKHFHPYLGAQLLRFYRCNERVASLIEQHHSPGDDQEAQLLHQIDDWE